MADSLLEEASSKVKIRELEEENKKLIKKIERLKKTMEITSKHGDVVSCELEEKVEASIKKLDESVRIITETIPVPVIISSVFGGKILYANEHLCRIFGFSSEEIFKHKASDLYHNPDDREIFLKQLSANGRVTGFEAKLKKNDGGILRGALFSQMLTFENEPCVLTVIYDLTERRNAEDEIRRLREELSQKEIKYLMFILEGEEYGVDILNVREIIGIMPITPVKDTPPYIKGIINLRNRIIPITDIRLRLGLSSAEYTNQTCIIVLESANNENKNLMGIIVDSVTDVRGIKKRDIRPPSELDLNTDTELILGIAKSENNIKIIINSNML
jgi:purine-binding chemotaxis protein CheW